MKCSECEERKEIRIYWTFWNDDGHVRRDTLLCVGCADIYHYINELKW